MILTFPWRPRKRATMSMNHQSPSYWWFATTMPAVMPVLRCVAWDWDGVQCVYVSHARPTDRQTDDHPIPPSIAPALFYLIKHLPSGMSESAVIWMLAPGSKRLSASIHMQATYCATRRR